MCEKMSKDDAKKIRGADFMKKKTIYIILMVLIATVAFVFLSNGKKIAKLTKFHRIPPFDGL